MDGGHKCCPTTESLQITPQLKFGRERIGIHEDSLRIT
jgi:hypothetical protein